jgi:osmotically-inducible protein OsmY
MPIFDQGRDPEADPAGNAALSRDVRAAIAGLLPPDSRVNVDAFDRVVVLSGLIDTPSERRALENAVLALDNVRAVVEQLETALPAQRREAPTDIARAALRELRGNSDPGDVEVKIVVDHEWLRAEGKAADIMSKEEVLRRLRRVSGVRGVIDRIQLP